MTKLLEQRNINLEEVDNKGYTALDLSINMGYYNCALELVKAGLRPKSMDFYRLKKDYFVEKEIDFQWFIESLNKKREMKDREANQYLFIDKENRNF